jgi:hypothetical protein
VCAGEEKEKTTRQQAKSEEFLRSALRHEPLPSREGLSDNPNHRNIRLITNNHQHGARSLDVK